MTDTNNRLLEYYYELIKPLYPTWTDEEPNDVNHKLYVVISDVTNSDASTKSNHGTQTTIQIAINSWELMYNSSMSVNTAAGAILPLVYPQPNTSFMLGSCQVVGTSVDDVTNRLGESNGRKYITRTLTIRHYIYQN